MRGKKTSVTLQKRTNTQNNTTGSVSVAWSDVVTFKGALIAKKLPDERTSTDKVTTYGTYRLYADASAIGAANLAEVTEKNRIQIGSDEYDIKGIADYTNEHGFYEIDLLLKE